MNYYNIMTDHRSNEGLLTQIWGPSFWHSLHCISFNYPQSPTITDKHNYKIFFKSLCHVLPCCDCRNHFTEHIKSGETILTNDAFENRNTLTKWLYNFHVCVNKKLGVNYNITYDDLCNKYNSYIASCDLTPEQKVIAYKNYYNKEAPYLSYDLAKYFIEYSKKRGLENYEKAINIFCEIDKHSDNWIYRNKKCWEIIKFMRLNSIKSVEDSGEFKGLPTISQLQLMKLLCTTIPDKIINHLIKKI
jgi:hypothetical protein